MDKRRLHRSRLSARCTICYPSADGTSMLLTEGITRDISCRGLGILTRISLRRETPVYIRILGGEGATTDVTGLVSYSRPGELRQYILGIRFCRICDELMARFLDAARGDGETVGSEQNRRGDFIAPGTDSVGEVGV
ncbi:MAG: PilZ domain-containing protein [Phycisphaerales bacterium]|nr:MAG: PilZ domain-containing protein [Phycisphaerales bacterium]